jgi:hypothetical protein
MHREEQVDFSCPRLASGLHLAAMFGIDNTTAIRYPTIARQLLETAAEQHDPAGSREPKGPNHP